MRDPNFVVIHPKAVHDISLKITSQPDGGARGRVRGSPNSLGFIAWELVVDIFLSVPKGLDPLTNRLI